MNMKQLDWADVRIGSSKNGLFGKFDSEISTGDMAQTHNHNSYLINDYIRSENKYMDSCAKVFDQVNREFAFKRDEDLVWVCSHCGYIHGGNEAPKACPICGSARIYFGIQY